MTRLKNLTASLLVLVLACAVATPVLAAEGPKVNINSADAAQLALLPRVGPALAARIVEHRETNGPFESTADLVLVRGIGEKTYSLMEPYLATEGETSLTEKVRGTQPASDEG